MTEANRNRLGNINNRFQGSRKRVLCVCSAGMLRSPTIAHVLSNPPFDFNTRAVGCDTEFALIPIDQVLIEWCDEIVCAEEEHKNEIISFCAKNEIDLSITTIHVLDIPDSFDFKDSRLVRIIKEKCKSIFLGE